MPVDWGTFASLSQRVPSFGEAFQQGMEQGRARRFEADQRNALAAYAENPNDATLNALAPYNPQYVVQQKQQMASAAEAQRAKQREALLEVSRLFSDVTPENYGQRVSIAQRMGIDISKVPQQFDPNWVAENKAMVELALKQLGGEGQFTLGQNQTRFDAAGNVIAQGPSEPHYGSYDNPDGSTTDYVYNPQNAPAAGFDNFYKNWLAPAEGGYVANDGGSGAPANFGINQGANPDIDVANLTPERAAQLMHDRYWVPSGADQMQDPALQAIHADTAVNMGVGAAQKLLQASGGDPQRYLALREQRYRQIGGPNLDGWLNRNQKLGKYVGGGAKVLAQGAPKQKDAPSGYRWKRDGNLEPIPGGPADKTGAGGADDRKAEAQLRKEFNLDPMVKNFKDMRQSYDKMRVLADKVWKGGSTTAQEDMAIIFSYMRLLDPTSVVREGEFATAQNAAGVPDQVRNAYNRALQGKFLNNDQIKNFSKATEKLYHAIRDQHNQLAQQFRSYATDYGVNPDRVARIYQDTAPAKPATGSGGWGPAKVVR